MPCANEDSEKPIFALAEKNNKTKSSCTKTKADVTYLSSAAAERESGKRTYNRTKIFVSMRALKKANQLCATLNYSV
jgi:hypothetical protein